MNTHQSKNTNQGGFFKRIRSKISLLTAGMLALAGLVSTADRLEAVAVSSNNAAAMIVRISPNVDRGVEISTGDVHLDMGSVELGASTQTVKPATVTIQGTISNTELSLSGSITGGWSYDNNQTLTSTGTNLLNVWASFTSISTNNAPSQGDEYFRVGTSSGAKLISQTGVYGITEIGHAGTGFGLFETNGDGADMDSMNPGDQKHLWVYFNLPPTTSISAPMFVNFVLSSRAGP